MYSRPETKPPMMRGLGFASWAEAEVAKTRSAAAMSKRMAEHLEGGSGRLAGRDSNADDGAGAMGALRENTLLGGAVRMNQAARGYRSAIDPVFLAAAVPARAGERVLELGLGAGAAALCLARRVPGCRITGIERDAQACELARANAALNGFAGRIEVLVGDVTRAPRALGGFDHAMANPPHLSAARADMGRPGQAPAANVEDGPGTLEAWIACARRALAPGGSFTLVHRADRLDDILAHLRSGFGSGVVFPLWPKSGTPAKRVLVQAWKGARGLVAVAPGLVLHQADGAYTQGAEDILRAGAALDLAGAIGRGRRAH